MAISFKGAHFPTEVILMGVRWYVAYPLSTRDIEELMEERGVELDHATITRWVIKYSPLLEEAFHRRKRAVWVSWRMDETYMKVKGVWHSLYRAVDTHGQAIDLLLTAQRDQEAALRCLKKAIRRHGVPEKITIDGSATNEAAITSDKAEAGVDIVRGSSRHPGRDRTHAPAQETTDGGGGRSRESHCGRTVLRPGRVIPIQTGATAPSWPPEQNVRPSLLLP